MIKLKPTADTQMKLYLVNKSTEFLKVIWSIIREIVSWYFHIRACIPSALCVEYDFFKRFIGYHYLWFISVRQYDCIP